MDEHKKWPGKLSHPHSYQQLREIARDLEATRYRLNGICGSICHSASGLALSFAASMLSIALL